MEFRKPPQINVLLALNTLPTEVIQKQKECEDNCQPRQRRTSEEVEKKGTHHSHSSMEASYNPHRQSLCEFIKTIPRLAPTRWAQRYT
jgi:hypothetical protein